MARLICSQSGLKYTKRVAQKMDGARGALTYCARADAADLLPAVVVPPVGSGGCGSDL
jgi:hypothetical protein